VRVHRAHRHDVRLELVVPVERLAAAVERVHEVPGHGPEPALLRPSLAEGRHRVEHRLRPLRPARPLGPAEGPDVGLPLVREIAARVDEVELLLRPAKAHARAEVVEVEEEVAVEIERLDVHGQQRGAGLAARRAGEGRDAVAREEEVEPLDPGGRVVVVEREERGADVAAGGGEPAGGSGRHEADDAGLGDEIEGAEGGVDVVDVVHGARQRALGVPVDADEEGAALRRVDPLKHGGSVAGHASPALPWRAASSVPYAGPRGHDLFLEGRGKNSPPGA
jgi:hypothetical protein